MASEMLSKVLDAENSDKEAQKAAHEQAQKTVDAAVEAGEGAVARKKAEAAKKAEEIIAVPNLDVAACAGTGACKRGESRKGGRGAQARSACGCRSAQSRGNQSGYGDGDLMKRLRNYRKVRRCQVGKA